MVGAWEGSDERPQFESRDGWWMARSVCRQEVRLCVCMFAKWEIRGKKAGSWSSPLSLPSSLPPSLGLAALAWAATNFHANHKGSGEWIVAPSSNCMHARACTRALPVVCLRVTFLCFFFSLAGTCRDKAPSARSRPSRLPALLVCQGRGEALCARRALLRKGAFRSRCFFSAAAALRLLMLTANNVLLDDCAPARRHRVETETNRGRVKEWKRLCWRGGEDEF